MILCDNIVFESQNIGGISKYWAQTISKINQTSLDVSFLEGSNAQNNEFRRNINLDKPIIHESGSSALRRWLSPPPRVQSDIFHSSYYRW